MSDHHPRWHDWYDYHRWRKRKRYQLRKEPFCRMCAQRGVVSAAEVVDHITPHNGNWDAFWLNEVQSLCADCHNSSKRWIESRGYDPKSIDPDGFPRDPRHPFNAKRGDP